MSLPTDLIQTSRRMRERAHELSGFLNALQKRLPSNEETRQAFTNARRTVGFIHSECTAVETTLAAARMVGELKPVGTTAIEMELHPKNLPPQVPNEKMLASLHRAGDHTLDELTDRHVAVDQPGGPE